MVRVKAAIMITGERSQLSHKIDMLFQFSVIDHVKYVYTSFVVAQAPLKISYLTMKQVKFNAEQKRPSVTGVIISLRLVSV